MENAPSSPSLETRAVHAGEPPERVQGAVVLPVFQTAMFEFSGALAGERLRYLRYGNAPNQEAVARRVADLEGGEAGVVTASGMSAISAALLGFLTAGDHVLAQPGLYGGTHALFTKGLPHLGMEVEFLEGEDPDAWERQLRPSTAAVYAESITNPTVRVVDLEGVAGFARSHGLISVIDNTFATPVNFRPAEHGFDLVVHSATKYLNGHSDLVAGVVVGGEEAVERARRALELYGASLDPHACFLLDRGLKTLPLRVARQNGTALRLARALEEHPAVARVNYPGLESHPDHGRARRLFDGYGGMLSFELRVPERRAEGRETGADTAARAAAERFMEALAIPVVAPSLGGVESLVTRPAVTSHRGMDPAEREALGITDALVRVSVGVEGAGDLVADFRQALDAVGR